VRYDYEQSGRQYNRNEVQQSDTQRLSGNASWTDDLVLWQFSCV